MPEPQYTGDGAWASAQEMVPKLQYTGDGTQTPVHRWCLNPSTQEIVSEAQYTGRAASESRDVFITKYLFSVQELNHLADWLLFLYFWQQR